MEKEKDLVKWLEKRLGQNLVIDEWQRAELHHLLYRMKNMHPETVREK